MKIGTLIIITSILSINIFAETEYRIQEKITAEFSKELANYATTYDFGIKMASLFKNCSVLKVNLNKKECLVLLKNNDNTEIKRSKGIKNCRETNVEEKTATCLE